MKRLLTLTLSVVLLAACGIFGAYKAGISIAHSITNSEQAAGHISAERAGKINADLDRADALGVTADGCFKRAHNTLDKVQCVASLESGGRLILVAHNLVGSPKIAQVESIILAALNGLKAYVDSTRNVSADAMRSGAVPDPEDVMKSGMEKMKKDLEALQKQP